MSISVDEYWEKLRAVGWLDFLPPDRHAEIRAHLAKNLADGLKYGGHAVTNRGNSEARMP